ncbi:MAG: hypothetical protein KAW17_02865 [Candidatus Eisenbacteria sp.]|nr:hypothetical protein [Candidatus Eisenbacteria bacterium]
MKMLFVTYYIGVEDKVMELLEDLQISAYTHWREVRGKPAKGHPRLGTHVWPGHNSALFFAAQDEIATAVMDGARKHNQKVKYEGITAMCWTLDDACEG